MKPNLTYLHDIAPDDPGFRQRMLAILKNEFPVELQNYLQAISSRDWQSAVRYIHKIKHKFGVLGMPEAYELCQKLETDLDGGDDSLHETVLGHLRRAEAYLKRVR